MEYIKKLTISSSIVGLVSLYASALLTGVNNVYYSKYVQEISPFTFTFFSFLITALFFGALTLFLKKQKRRDEHTKEIKIKDFLGINLSTASVFLSFYFALKYIEPAIVGAIEIGVGPAFALIIGNMLKTKDKINKSNVITAIGTFSGSLFLIWASINGKSGVQIESDFTMVMIFGLIASVFCGLGATLAAIYSKNLSDLGWSSTEILAHRFYAIIPISALLAFMQEELIFTILANWQWILVVSITGVIIPLYLLQIGIKFSSPFIVMMTICFVPVFTFIFQIFDPRIQLSFESLIGIIIILAFACFSIYENYNKKGA